MTESQDFASVGQKTLVRDNVLEFLREAIINGTLHPGQQLVEGQLAERFAISRAPIREALQHLTKDGLVENVPYKGSFITELSEDALHELFAVRMILEGAAAEMAASRAKPDDIEKLRHMLARMTGVAPNGNYVEKVKADIEFHALICEMSGNKLLLRLWNDLRFRIHRWMLHKSKLMGGTMVLADDHVRIVDKIAEGNGAAALQVVKHHLEKSKLLLLNRQAHLPTDGNT